mgnify:CR=1 FL=1|nr:MAG TPA_asm: hypothetical protein [Caudoviricetes sp.]
MICVLYPDIAQLDKEYFIDDYNNGHFPFVPKPYKFAVGYAKERDTALVEVDSFRFLPNMI